MPVSRPPLLLTRPQAQSLRFAGLCRDRLGGDVPIVVSPILTIRFRDDAVDLDGFAGVIATSGNGIEALARLGDLTGIIAYCVGNRTADLARSHGMNAVSAQGDVGDLIALVRKAAPTGLLLHVRGEVARADIAGPLETVGVKVQSTVLYDQVAVDLTEAARALLQRHDPVVLPIFSPRSADLLSGACKNARTPLRIAALSPAVADAWHGPAPETLKIAKKPDANSMLCTLCDIYTGESA